MAKKIEPKKYNIAKQAYLEDRENIAIKAIEYYFNLINAKIKFENSSKNLEDAQELIKIGNERNKVGAITNEEFLKLKLNLYNAKADLSVAEQDLKDVRVELNIFLNIDKSTIINCTLPDHMPGTYIDIVKALDLAITNNSIYNELYIRELEYKKTLAQEKANNRFTSSISLSYGLSGKNERFVNSYQKFGEKQNLNIGFKIPLIDWGEGKGAIIVAKSKLEAEQIRIEQERLKFEQKVSANVQKFNLQGTLVENKAMADTIAAKGYEISYKVFILGELDVISLNQARKDKESARISYISMLQQYWYYWYNVRKLTLYDFKNNISLSNDFENLLK